MIARPRPGSELVVVGSSPLMLMHALAHARSGCRVRILDRAAVVGGSWKTPAMLGFSSVECGVHLLENRPGLYARLEAMGIDLAVDTDGFLLWKGRRYPLSGSRAFFHAMVAFNALRRGHFDAFRRIGRSAINSARHVRVPLRYPAEGCRQIHRRLSGLLEAEGATLRLGTAIDLIDVDSDGRVRCHTSLGLETADHVLIASRAHAPIRVDGHPLAVAVETGETCSVVLRVRCRRPPGYTYVEILGDALLKRVRDVTRFTQPAVPSGEALLCVQMRDAGRQYLEARSGEELARHLCSLGLLDPADEVVAWERADYRLQTIGNADLQRLSRKTAGRVIAVPTTDFADGFQPGTTPPKQDGTWR